MAPKKTPKNTQTWLCENDGCTESFNTEKKLRDHEISVHNIAEPYKCTIQGCNKSFAKRKNFTAHISNHNAPLNFPCTHQGCEKAFKSQQKLNGHLNVHEDNRPYVCSHEGCDKAFHSEPNLREHVKTIHLDFKPFLCTWEGCKHTNRRKRDLKKHFRKVHMKEEKPKKGPYTCEIAECGRTFSLHGDYENHKVTHSDDRPFKCTHPGCDFTCKLKKVLTRHANRHLDIMPYKCDWDGCSAAYPNSTSLKEHKKTHTGEKNYKCTHTNWEDASKQCGGTFPSQSRLSRHIECWHTAKGIRRKAKKQDRIRRLLDRIAKDMYKPEHVISFKCMNEDDPEGSYGRIDFLIEIKNDQNQTVGFVFLEVDEEQHTRYSVSCEVRRMTDVHRSLIMEGNTFPIAFVRYNPDAYSIDNLPVETRDITRQEELTHVLKTITFDRPLSIIYMYYDMIDDQPYVFTDPAYDDTLKQCVTQCIVGV